MQADRLSPLSTAAVDARRVAPVWWWAAAHAELRAKPGAAEATLGEQVRSRYADKASPEGEHAQQIH